MEKWRMDDIIRKIEEGEDFEQAVDYFFSLSHDDKVSFLEQFNATKSEEAGIYLNLVLRKVEEKDVQKLIKKLLFRLKTRGVHVDEPLATGEPALKKIEVIRNEKAFASNYDTEGTRVVLLAVEMKRRQYIFIHAVCHFSDGLVDLAVFPLPQNDLDGLISDYTLKTQPPMALVPVSPRYAAYLVEEASGRTEKYAEEMKGLHALAADLKGEIQRPADIFDLAVPDDTEPKTTEEILAHYLFEPFPFTWDSVEDDKKALNEILNPSIVVPPYMIQEKRQAFLKELLQKDALRAKRPLVKRMLEEYAYLFHALEAFDFYRGIAERVHDEELIDTVMLHFAGKAFEENKPEQQPGVLVNPFQQGPGQPGQPPPMRR